VFTDTTGLPFQLVASNAILFNMEIPNPNRGARPMGSLPQIQIHDPSEMYRKSSRSSSYNSAASPGLSSIPMSIPNAREFVPPPLPPPRHIADIADGGHNGPDNAWKWGNNSHTESRDWGRATASIPQGSSLHGGTGSYMGRKDTLDEQLDFQRRGSSISTIKSDSRDGPYQRDEGYESLGASVWSNKSVLHFLSTKLGVPTTPASCSHSFMLSQIREVLPMAED